VALGIVAGQALPPERATLPDAAPELLHRAALAYIAAWDRGESELADLLDLALARPLPSFVAVGGQLQVSELAGAVHAVTWQGLFVDANLRVAAAVPRAQVSDSRLRDFYQLSALEGSVQEDRLFAREFGVEAISTARLLALAGAAGTPLLTLDAGNLVAGRLERHRLSEGRPGNGGGRLHAGRRTGRRADRPRPARLAGSACGRHGRTVHGGAE
jgi:hypothetical protein